MNSLGTIAYIFNKFLPLKITCELAKLEGRINYHRCVPVRKKIIENLTTIYKNTISDEEKERMAQQFFENRHLRRTLMILTPKLSYSTLKKIFPISGLENLDEALSKGNGVILLGSHLNSTVNWIMFFILRSEKYNAFGVNAQNAEDDAKKEHKSLIEYALEKWYREQRVFTEDHMLYAKTNIRPIIKCLKQNNIIITLGDGFHAAKFADVHFLGRTWPFATGIIRIAQMTGAPILPMFCTGTPTKDYLCKIEKPIPLDKTDNIENDLKNNITKFANRLENHIKQNIITWEIWAEEHFLDFKDHI